VQEKRPREAEASGGRFPTHSLTNSLDCGRRLLLDPGEEALSLRDALDLDRDRLDRLLDALELIRDGGVEERSTASLLVAAAELSL